MSKLLSIVLLAAGTPLMVHGLDATNSLSSNPAPASGGVWLIVVGGAGRFMQLFSSPKRRHHP
jgi:hypothetical protein